MEISPDPEVKPGGGELTRKILFGHGMYGRIISLDNLFVAWKTYRKGKRKNLDVQEFEFHLEDNIFKLHEELAAGQYRPSQYQQFLITDPKVRTISKAPVRDRLLHQAIYQTLYPLFDEVFIHDSYSCRNDKGTHKAFERLVKGCRKVSDNYTADCWSIKMDIKKFFDSIDHEILLELLSQRIGDPILLNLLGDIVRSFSFSPGIGMPLGNLTSQLFANVYMDPLDKFIKHQLKAKYYLRYADDFLILSSNPEELLGYFVEINTFLKEKLKLQIHQNKTSLRKLSQGIDFVGYAALPHYQVPRHRTVKRIFKKVNMSLNEELEKAMPSYLGYIQHVSSRKIKDQMEYRVRKRSKNSIIDYDSTF